MTKNRYQLRSYYKQLQTASTIDCASQCLGAQDGQCLAYKFHESTKVCKVSDEVAQETESCTESIKVYAGIGNSQLSVLSYCLLAMGCFY